MLPVISIIVATKNEERNIERCLRSIRGQEYRNLELIIVDNHSQDRTRDLAKRYTDMVYDFQKEHDLSCVRNFRGAQLTFGVRMSMGEIVFFPDADMVLGPELLLEIGKLIAHYDALYIREVVVGGGFLQSIRNFERSFYNETPIDAVRCVKRSFYDRVGGFDEAGIEFGFDDWDFTKKLKSLGAELAICKGHLFHHEGHGTISSYLHKKSNYASGYAPYIKKWGKEDRDVCRQFGAYYRMIGVFTEEGKWKRFFSSPLYAVGVLGLRALVGISFIWQKWSQQLFKKTKILISGRDSIQGKNAS